MNRLFISFVLLFSNSTLAQKVPQVQAKVISSLQYSEKDIQEWERYLKLYDDIEEREIHTLSLSDQKFKNEFELRNKGNSKYKSPEDNDPENKDYFDPEFAPWQTEYPGCSWYCGASYTTRVSSSLAPQNKNTYSNENIFDNDTRTAWVEGVKGYGTGEYVEFTFSYYSPRATTGYIANGYNKNAATWRNNSRVKTLHLYEDDRLTAIIHLKDTRDLQSFTLPHPFPNRPDNTTFSGNIYDENGENILHPTRLKFVITDIYKGDKYEDTAISEFYFDGLDVHCLAKGTLIRMADTSEKNIENIQIEDLILSYNKEKDLFEPKTVTKIYQVTHTDLLKITLSDTKNNTNKEIITTTDHPFLSEQGWTSYDPEKTKRYKRYSSSKITQYKTGSLINAYTNNKKASFRIVTIEPVSSPTETYTLEFDGEGAFIANGLLAGQE